MRADAGCTPIDESCNPAYSTCCGFEGQVGCVLVSDGGYACGWSTCVADGAACTPNGPPCCNSASTCNLLSDGGYGCKAVFE